MDTTLWFKSRMSVQSLMPPVFLEIFQSRGTPTSQPSWPSIVLRRCHGWKQHRHSVCFTQLWSKSCEFRSEVLHSWCQGFKTSTMPHRVYYITWNQLYLNRVWWLSQWPKCPMFNMYSNGTSSLVQYTFFPSICYTVLRGSQSQEKKNSQSPTVCYAYLNNLAIMFMINFFRFSILSHVIFFSMPQSVDWLWLPSVWFHHRAIWAKTGRKVT